MTRLEFISLAPGRRKDIIEFVKALKRYGFTSSDKELFSRIKISDKKVIPLFYKHPAFVQSETKHGFDLMRELPSGFKIVMGGYYTERYGCFAHFPAVGNIELKNQFGSHCRSERRELE